MHPEHFRPETWPKSGSIAANRLEEMIAHEEDDGLEDPHSYPFLAKSLFVITVVIMPCVIVVSYFYALTQSPSLRWEGPEVQPYVPVNKPRARLTDQADAGSGEEEEEKGGGDGDDGDDGGGEERLSKGERIRGRLEGDLAKLISREPHALDGVLTGIHPCGPGGVAGRRIFDRQLLARYDGSDAQLPVYVACMGIVFDVSNRRALYAGETAPYSLFSGRDATQAMARGCTDPDRLPRPSGKGDDSPAAREERLFLWFDAFKSKYARVGVLLNR